MRDRASPFGWRSPFGRLVARFFGWIVNGFTIEGVPRVPSAATPTITGTTLSGPFGTYFATNLTTLVETEIELTAIAPTHDLAPLGSAGQQISVEYVNLSTESGVITIPGAYTLREDYTTYGANGSNKWSTFEALWTRQNAEVEVDLGTDANGIGGRRISITQSASIASPRYIFRDDTRIPDGAWDTIQIRGRAKLALADDYAGIGWGSATTFCGIHIRGTSTNAGRVALVNTGDVGIASPGTSMMTSVATSADVEFLLDIASNKRTVSAKAWLVGGSEPGSWQQSFTLGADVSLANGLRQFIKVSTGGDYGQRSLGWHMTINGPAPTF